MPAPGEHKTLQAHILHYAQEIDRPFVPRIPSAGMVTMIVVLQSVGLPVEAIAILLPIDRLLDAFRTAVNVEDDMIASMVVQKVTGLATQD